MNFKKTFLTVAPLSLIALTLTACTGGGADEGDPKAVAEAYMEAVQAQDYEAVQELLTAETATELNTPPQEIIDQITPIEEVSVADFTVEEGATTVEPEVNYMTADGREGSNTIWLIKTEEDGWKVDSIISDVTYNSAVLGVQAVTFGGENVGDYSLLAGTVDHTYPDNELFEEVTFNSYPTEEQLREDIVFKTGLEESLRSQLETVIQEETSYGFIDGEVCDFEDNCEPRVNSYPSSYEYTADPIDGVVFTFDDLVLNDTVGGEITAMPATSGEVRALFIEGELSLNYSPELG